MEVLGRTSIRYSEGGRTAFVDSEVLAESDAILAYRDSIRWDPPNELKPLAGGDHTRIIENIRRALESRGYKLRDV